MNKKEIINKLKYLNQQGFIRASDFIAYRQNDNGEIGRLIEFFFEVNENNFATPDLGDIELKATVLKSQSAITMSSSKPVKGLSTRAQYERFKKLNKDDGLHRFYETIKCKPNKSGFLLKYEDDNIALYHNDEYISSYLFDLNSKISKVLFIFAKKIGTDADATYHIQEAYLAEGPKNIEQVLATDADMLRIDIRCGVYKNGSQRGKMHDRGTAIRFTKNKLFSLFNHYERLL